MGRAYSVRKESIEKTNAAKGKMYSLYSREIYQMAKEHGTNLDANIGLKRVIERAKRDQVPMDIINRAIEKVNSGVDTKYEVVYYEVFGIGGSTLIIECLTDNINRTLSYIRPVLNKNKAKMGVMGSVSYLYDHLSVVCFKGLDEETVLEELILNDIEVEDIFVANEEITVYAQPQDLFKVKEIIFELMPNVEFIVEEIAYVSQDTIVLEGEQLEVFQKMLTMLEEIEDVKEIYHNVLVI